MEYEKTKSWNEIISSYITQIYINEINQSYLSSLLSVDFITSFTTSLLFIINIIITDYVLREAYKHKYKIKSDVLFL